MEQAPEESKEMEECRSSPPGKKRLFIVLSVLFSFLLGIPFWLKSTEIHRTPLPFVLIEEHNSKVMSSSLVFPCYFHYIFLEESNILTKPEFIIKKLEEIRSSLSKLMDGLVLGSNDSFVGCSSFDVMTTLDTGDKCWRVGVPEGFPIWPCGLKNSRLSDVINQNDDNAVDDFIWKYSNESFNCHQDDPSRRLGSGIYTILNINAYHESVLHPSEKLADKLKAIIGKYRHGWILSSRKGIWVEEKELRLMNDMAVRFFICGGSYEHPNKIFTDEKDSAIPLAADGKATLSFSLLNAEPEDWLFDWNFNDLEAHFLGPVIEALRPVADLSIESQVLYYTPSSVRSSWDPNHQKHIVLSQDLPFFVNSNEWHLDTSTGAAGRSKLLHFSIYISAMDECPLYFKLPDARLSATNGFTSPGWGGVVVFNPPSCSRNPNGSVQHLSVEDLEPVFLVIIAQIRVLFGLPVHASLSDEDEFTILPAINSAFSQWELDVLIRRRTAADVASSASTLRSLSHLVQSLPNMVIMDEIGDQVRSSLVAAEIAEKDAELGLYYAAAESARRARALAEAAFFQPSIMSLLYLPMEHHFAIYTPFFVPVLLHTILAAIKEIKRYTRERKKYSARAQIT